MGFVKDSVGRLSQGKIHKKQCGHRMRGGGYWVAS